MNVSSVFGVNVRKVIACALLFGTVGALSAPAQQTWAWRQISSPQTGVDSSSADNEFGYGENFDVHGNTYVDYVDQGADYTLHLAKLGPSSEVDFNISAQFSAAIQPLQIYVSPPISGNQYVYLMCQTDLESGNSSIWIQKYDTSGNAQWASPLMATNVGGFSDYFRGFDTDSAGNAYLALWSGTSAGEGELAFITINSSGVPQTPVYDTAMDPNLAKRLPNGDWLSYGTDNDTLVGSQVGGPRWDVIDPSTGNAVFGATDTDFYNPVATDPSTLKTYAVWPIVDGSTLQIAVAETTETYTAADPADATFGYWVALYNGSGSQLYLYPSTGTVAGDAYQLESFGLAYPIYVVGDTTSTTRFVASYTPKLVQNWSIPCSAELLLPADDGFYTYHVYAPNNTLDFDHANTAGSYDWGESYAGTVATPPTFGSFNMFANRSFNVVVNVPNNPTQVYVDHFYRGIALNSITSAGSISSGNPITFTITLNGNAGTGGETVYLYSNTNDLLFSNSTRAISVTIPAGSNSAQVTANAQIVTNPATDIVSANDNGVIRYAPVTVSP